MKFHFTNVYDVLNYFSDEKFCEKHLATLRWNNNIICPHCNSQKKVIYKMKKGYKCGICRKSFSVKKGTIFESSPIPLQKWFATIWIVSSNKNITTIQLQKDIGITQKTAWNIRKKINSKIKSKPRKIKYLKKVELDPEIKRIMELIINTPKIILKPTLKLHKPKTHKMIFKELVFSRIKELKKAKNKLIKKSPFEKYMIKILKNNFSQKS